MGLKRCTFFFQDDSDHGWSETHFLPNGVLLPAALIAAQAVLLNRVKVLGSSASCLAIRASDDEFRGDSLVFYVPRTQGVGVAEAGTADIGNTALLIRLQNLTPPYRIRGMLYLRGIPDDITRLGGQYTPNAGWNLDLGKFSDSLHNNGFGLRGTDAAAPSIITGMTQAGVTGVVTVQLAGIQQFTMTPPSIINITGLRGFGGIRGRHPITSFAPDKLSCTFKVKRVMPLYDAGGLLQIMLPTFRTIDVFTPVRITHRIAGRVFGQPVGRRSGR